MKKIVLSCISGMSFVFLMLGFVFGTIAFKELDFSLVFVPGYLFTFFSIYLIFILHELGHAFCGYLTGYRLVAFGLGNFLLTKKSGKFSLSRTAVLKNVGAQYIGLKEDESDQRIILMLAGGLMVHLSLILLAILYGILTANWYFAATWICLNLSFFLINAKPVGITDGAKIWELLQQPENRKYAYSVLRHSAQTLLAPQEYDLQDFIIPVAEDAKGSFAESIQLFQGLVFIFDSQIETAKKHFQSLLDKTNNTMSQTLSQLYLLQIALLEGDYEKAEEYASNRGVKSFLSLKMTDTQSIQAWYQFLVKKDMEQTDKAIKIARQNMVTSRLVRDEKRYYESWLAELEKELSEGV